MIEFVLIAGGFVIGAAIGRWWALLAAVAFGVWAGTTEEVEVSGWVIGIGYGALAGLGIAAGLVTRRFLRRLGETG